MIHSDACSKVGKAGLTNDFLNSLKIKLMNKEVGKFRFGRGFLGKRPRLPMPSIDVNCKRVGKSIRLN